MAKIRLPSPAPSGKTPLTAVGLKKAYGGLQVLDGVDLAIDRWATGLNGEGQGSRMAELIKFVSRIPSPEVQARLLRKASTSRFSSVACFQPTTSG